jgi:predicted acyltransferase
MDTPLNASPKRLLSLDILRGITISGMLLVNNPGSWEHIYTPLEHAPWHGLTPTDLVFPFFMFIMGVSMYISMSKFDFTFSPGYLKKLVKRSILIFLVGMAIGWFSILCRGVFNIGTDLGIWERFTSSVFPYDRIRILGVMQRLALSSFFASLLVVLIPSKHWLKTVGAILVGYYLILLLGDGFELTPNNIIIRVDTALLGVAHIYHGESIPFDPEGLLSTIPCIAHVILGIYCGKLIKTTANMTEKVNKLFIYGTILLFAGLLLNYGIPINKKIWTPTYVLATCGLASLLLALLTWIIDIKSKKRWSVFFESFGINPLFLYVLGGVISILLGSISFPVGDQIVSIKGFIYNSLVATVHNENVASLLFALFFIFLCWIIGHQLYKRKIYIKL